MVWFGELESELERERERRAMKRREGVASKQNWFEEVGEKGTNDRGKEHWPPGQN